MKGQGKIDQLLVVRASVADLRRKPVDAQAGYTHDDLEETQLLFNELLVYRDEQDDWYYVEAREQLKAVPGKDWQGYPGWVRKKHVSLIDKVPLYNGVITGRVAPLLAEPKEGASPLLFVSLGTRVPLGEKTGQYHRVTIGEPDSSGWVAVSDVSIPTPANTATQVRRNILQIASLFVGVPYLWGGRSMFMADLTAAATGVDCSGFTNLVYRANGVDIPRDAHDQWLAATRITRASLKPGDLVFVSKENQADRVDHVMLYTGEERFMEASETGTQTRERTFRDKFGVDLARLENTKFIIDKKHVYFGKVPALDKTG